MIAENLMKKFVRYIKKLGGEKNMRKPSNKKYWLAFDKAKSSLDMYQFSNRVKTSALPPVAYP